MIPRVLTTPEFSRRELIIYTGFINKLMLPEINEKLIAYGTDPITEREWISRCRNYQDMTRPEPKPSKFRGKTIF